MAMISEFEGPIPGENFTSDTKNYAWHRPPDFTDLDEAIDWSIKKLGTKEAAYGLLTMLDMGLPIASAARAFVMSGVGEGRWTPDFAILIAGPVARIMMTMAKAAGIKYELGIDEAKPPSKAFLSYISTFKKSDVGKATDAVDPEAIKDEASAQEAPAAPVKSGGFASRPTGPATTPEGIM